MLGDDLLRQRVLRVENFQLHQQAFPQIARGHARRIEFLHHRQRFFHVFHRIIADSRDFLERGGQVSVLIQVADDRFGDLAHHFGADR